MEKEKRKNIVILTLGVLLILSLLFGIYSYGFKQGYEGRINKIIDFYESWDLDTKDLFIDGFNGIKLYSDSDNFTRIKSLMFSLNISNISYPYLHGIAYYQSRKVYDNFAETECSGSYDNNFRNVELWKCNKTMEIRNNSIPSENIEKFVLMHELGHYLFDMGDSEEEQICADNYAKQKGVGENKLK